jgi:hypothetical protein
MSDYGDSAAVAKNDHVRHGRRWGRAFRRAFAVVCAVVVVLTMAATSSARGSAQATARTEAETSSSVNAMLQASLGTGWWRSRDIMLESSEDSSGYHLFLAKGSAAYAWRALATIRPGDLDVASWTGYSCLTGDGKYAVAVVAPSYYANSPMLRDRGAFAYVVDVATGAVHPVVAGVALAWQFRSYRMRSSAP